MFEFAPGRFNVPLMLNVVLAAPFAAVELFVLIFPKSTNDSVFPELTVIVILSFELLSV
jgi:hypothetical protein